MLDQLYSAAGNSKMKSTLSKILTGITAVFGVIAAGVGIWNNTVARHFETKTANALAEYDQRIKAIQAESEVRHVASEYISILKDPNSPNYLRGITLTAMLSTHYFDPDLLFQIGYEIENTHGPGPLHMLFYKFGAKYSPVDSPIGYVEIHCSQKLPFYGVTGWALGKRGIKAIEASLDGTPHEPIFRNGAKNRSYLSALFPQYNAGYDDFSFNLAKAELQGRTVRLVVRLVDAEGHHRDIFDRNLRFREDRVVQLVSQPGGELVLSGP